MNDVDLIIKNAYTVTMNENRDVISNSCIVIKDDVILEVGKNDLLNKYNPKKIIDAKGKFIFPGFVSTHSHLFQTMLKGLGRDKLLLDWLDSSVRRALHKFDKETCYIAALVGCIEAIKTGTTTILDYMYCNTKDGLADSVIQAFEDIGIRGMLARGFTKTDSFPEEFACEINDTEDRFFNDVKRLEKIYRSHPRIDIAMAPGIIWDLTDENSKEMRKLANDLNIPITMHVVETPDDDEYCVSANGMRTIPYLEKMGLLGPDFIAVHCVCMNDEEIEIFEKYDVKISYNPISNMVLASGVAPIPKFIEKGLTVSLACDGSASNDTQNMLEVLKMSTLLQKVHNKDAKVMPASTVLEMATIGGAKTLNKSDYIGSIEAGKKADIIIYNPYNAISIPVHDPISTLIYSSSPSNIETTIIGGKIIMENNKIMTINEEEILKKAQSIASKLADEIGLGNYQWGSKISNIGL